MATKKGMGIKTSVKSGNFRPTKAGAGMTKKGVEAYREANPGSKLKTAVTLGQAFCGRGQAPCIVLCAIRRADEAVSRSCQGPRQQTSPGS
jgi:hypothetical protein